jgi:hypothetical protein
MKRNYKLADGSKIAFLIMILLASLSVGLTSATINNYLSASKAASGFRMAVSGVTCRKENSGCIIGIDVNFKNQSEWDLSITSMRSIVYIDGQYVWGRNYD